MIKLTRGQRYGTAVVVALAHLSLVSLLTAATAKEPPPKRTTTTLELKGAIELMDRDEREGKGDLHLNCPSTYDGIGIMLDYAGRISDVAQGWPADRAGLRPGDQIVGGPFEIVRTNGFREFDVRRDGRTVHMKLSTAPICFRDGPNL